MSSGAIQYGVPTTDVRFDSSDVRLIAKPKSATFTAPSKSTLVETEAETGTETGKGARGVQIEILI